MSMTPFVATQLWKIAVLGGVAYLGGLLVRHGGIRVNYTRKINHFTLFFIPQLINQFYAYDRTPLTRVGAVSITFAMLFVYLRPIRTRIPVVATMFLSIDRPEDRPHTMTWLLTQYLACYPVLFTVRLFLVSKGCEDLLFVLIFVVSVGDGLAEPIGVRFGRRRYSVGALFTDKSYTRSYVGSACVFLVSVIVILVFRESFTPAQLLAGLALIPAAVTLTEARSPHSWDAPFMFLVGGVLLVGIVYLVP